MRFLFLILKNLMRNRVRSVLTALAVVFLVAIFSMITTVLRFLDMVMVEQETNVKTIATERFRIPSQFDRRFVEQIVYPGGKVYDEIRGVKGFHGQEMHNIWHFVAFTLDPEMKDQELSFFVVATIPEKIAPMTEGLEGFDPKLAELMKAPPISRLPNAGLLLGADRLAKLGKKVGDRFRAIAASHREGTGARKPIEFEFEVVGELPPESRWALGGFMDYEYLDRVLKEKKNERDGKVNLAWFGFDDQPSANAVSGSIERNIRELKVQTMSSAVNRHLDPYRGIMWGIKFLLLPVIMVVMTIIVANSISISVRERQDEIAVLKVLGFRPPQILSLVLGEAMLLSIAAGLLSSGVTYWLVNHAMGGINTPIAFFPAFFVPWQVFWWGPAIGAVAAFLGGVVPAWSARRVKVSEVFAKVT